MLAGTIWAQFRFWFSREYREGNAVVDFGHPEIQHSNKLFGVCLGPAIGIPRVKMYIGRIEQNGRDSDG